jgi:hypothetical protein
MSHESRTKFAAVIRDPRQFQTKRGFVIPSEVEESLGLV